MYLDSGKGIHNFMSRGSFRLGPISSWASPIPTILYLARVPRCRSNLQDLGMNVRGTKKVWNTNSVNKAFRDATKYQERGYGDFHNSSGLPNTMDHVEVHHHRDVHQPPRDPCFRIVGAAAGSYQRKFQPAHWILCQIATGEFDRTDGRYIGNSRYQV